MNTTAPTCFGGRAQPNTKNILGALGYVVHTYGLLIFRFYYRPRMVPNAVYERKMVITVVARDIHKQDTSRVCACVTREKHSTFRSFPVNETD